MAIELEDLNDLDPTLVTSELDTLVERMQELHPDADFKRGPFHDTVAYYHAQLSAGLRTNINRYLSARSLMEIQADPTLAEDDVVNGVLSNWGLERQAGSKAVGEVTIVLSDDTSVTLSNGAIFSANGQNFLTDQVYTAKDNEDLILTDSDRLLTALSDGNYAFTVFVEAENAGSAGMLKKDVALTPESPPSNFVTAYATSDFTGGDDEETNEELLARLQQGIAAKTCSNRVNMAAMLREITAFARVVDMSIIGYGDEEMIRDQHTIFPISGGGRVDWYLRSQAALLHTSLTKTATLIEKTAGNHGIWQFSVVKTDAPGFYEIRNIRPTESTDTDGGFEITEDIRGLDLTGSGLIPDIDTQLEGAYSYYQTATIRFEDTITDTTDLDVGDTQDYDVEAVGMPLIDTLQQHMNNRDYRSVTHDCLIKAPVPCFVQLSFTIYKRADEDDPDTDAIKLALIDAVHSVSFVGRLYASQLYDVIHGYLTGQMRVGAIDMFGRIRCPDDTTVYLRDPAVLEVVDDATKLTTANTVQFFVESDDISITIETGVPMPL